MVMPDLPRVLLSREPPGADPHAGWCGEDGLDTRPYPISRIYVARNLETIINENSIIAMPNNIKPP
ncbi:MAG: hypothetical protein Kow0060_19520 [Methylohalobius crimeensis]